MSEYDDMTPYQLNMIIEETEKMKEKEEKNLIQQAYLISRWVWAKKINIEEILGEKKEKKAMTDDEMLQQVKVLNVMFGGEIKEN